MEHELKTLPEYFQAVRSGAKPFELRKEDDRHFEVGDMLYLREWEPILSCYTGAAIRARVTYVLRGGPWLPVGYVAMGVRPQGEQEAYVAQLKQAVMDAFDGVDREQRAGAVFDNPLLAVASRIALAWMDLDAARAQGEG